MMMDMMTKNRQRSDWFFEGDTITEYQNASTTDLENKSTSDSTLIDVNEDMSRRSEKKR